MVSVCTTCKGLQKHLNGPANGQESDVDAVSVVQWVDATLPTVRQATSQGCRACALLLQGILLHHDRFAGVPEDSIRISAQTYHSTGSKTAQDHLAVDVRWKDEGDQAPAPHLPQGYPDLRLEFFTDGDGQSSFTAIGQGRLITENPGQECGSQSVRNMIGECLSKHSKCRHTQPTTLPKRVLDVMTNEPTKGIPLHESAQTSDGRYEHGEYLALSYCWGTGRGIPQTTFSTLASHKKGIAWKSLPRTFQEAILLTRARGFRWLWIDALCIVQDDAADKLEASLGLADIFGNAFLTIAATSAVDTAGGLYAPIVPPFKLQATDSKGSLSKIYVREQPSHYSFKAPFNDGAHMNDWELPFNMSPEANQHTPLLRRAWAYSERLLSPRVLHFTDSEMILECREAYQCECGRIDNAAYDSRTTDSVKQEYARIVGARGTGAVSNDKRIDSVASQLAATSLTAVGRDLAKKRDDALQLWSYIVTEYTARHLTFDADRLVAIAAVAGTLSRALDAGYVAGHWTCSTLGLLWYPNESSHCRRPKTSASHHVPSWSWASVEGSPIFFDNASAMDLACTASWTTDGAPEDLWSPTSGGALQLSAGMAADATLQVDADNEFSLVRNGVSVEFRPDIVPPRGEDALESGDQLVCVLVSMTFRSSIIGLVLKPLAADPTRYRRVGRFECYECQKDDSDEDAEDAEALFGHWFPDIQDMTILDEGPQRSFVIV